MTTSEIFRQSARVRVVGVVTWCGFDFDDVVDDEGRFENSWIAVTSAQNLSGVIELTIDINR